MDDLNPQARQMADESMVRTLAAQARAIWPQEAPLLARYGLPAEPLILDAGCGTGEASSRLAELHPRGRVLGVDVIDASLELARSRYGHLAERLAFEKRSVYELGLPDGRFDLTVCRHVIHSIPYPERVLKELVRVTRRGGTVHLIPEDYGMLHFSGDDSLREFWNNGPAAFGKATGTDLYAGRNAFGLLAALKLESIKVDYVIVDTLRVPRESFAAIMEAWRDGYAEPISQVTGHSLEATRDAFARTIATIRDPKGYGVWMVPVVSGRVPANLAA
jgi:ubiquinone/menaquinone biosynthesis C-methylase UbiE